MSRTVHTDSCVNALLASVHTLRTKGFPITYFRVVVGCSLVVALLAAFILYRDYQQQLRYWQEKLTRVADANQHLLHHWLKERNEDAQLLASLPCTAIAVQRPPLGESAQPYPCRQHLDEELVSVASVYAYAGAYVLDGSGRVVVQSKASPPLNADLIRKVVVSSQQGTLTIPVPGDWAGYSQVAVVSPIRQPRPPGTGAKTATTGHAVVLTRPEAIASLMLTDAGVTTTGETVLVTLHAGQPVFISPLRHWMKPGRSSPPVPAYPARISLLERRNLFGVYSDYRGVPVLVVTRYLPELGWAMVTKVDRSEALAGFRQTFALGITIGFLSILTILSVAAAWRRHNRIQRLQLDLARGRRTEEDLRRSEERFWVALQNSPVVVFNQDRELRYTWINKPVPPWSEHDYVGKTDEEIIGIEEGSGLTALKRPVLDTGVGARREWTFAFRGEKRVYDINIQPLRNESGEIVGITCASIDISDRKRAEERLREYEKVVEGLQEMIVVLDRDYRYLLANRAFLEYRGMQREQIIGRRVPEVLNKGVFEDVLKAKMDECLQGRIVSFEMKNTYPRRGERDLLISYLPIAGPEGVDRIACVLLDITERKLAEKALRASETRYRLLFESNPAGIFRSTPDGQLLEANEAFARIFGYQSRDELLRFPDIHFYLHPEKRDFLVAALRQQGSLTNYEFCGRHRDGSPVWALANMAFVAAENGGPDVLEGTFIDVTARKNAEEALQHSEAQLRAFIENAPYGIFRYGGGHFLSANPALVQMLGCASEAEVLALNLASDVFHPTAEFKDLIAISNQQPHFGPSEVRWKRRDGSLVLAQLRGRVTGSSEKDKTIEALVEDITHKRALEEHFGQSDKLEVLGRVASGVAHDFNNLLLGITLNLEHAIAQTGRADHLREELEQTMQAARSAASLTRQLLVFGRKRARQQKLVNLNDAVIRSQHLVKSLAGDKIHVHLSLGPDLAPVQADPMQVQQVLLNLVSNARDAVSGEGEITITTRNIELQKVPADEYFSAAPRAGHYVVLEVSDTGIGISRETLTHIFEPFYTTKEEGSGLGLSTSYGIAAQSSGYMSVQTEPGHGATLKLYLPRQQEDSSDRDSAEA